MIKFFRKIRQRLLTENKFSKYLLYAIGEIILVMIGILLALQVNNWNKKKQLTHKEHRVLMEIKNDLIVTQNELNQDISTLNHLLTISNSIIEYLDTIHYKDYNESKFKGKLYYYLNNVKLYPRTIAYENLKSIGAELISNDSIRFHLADIFDRKLPRILLLENRTFENERQLKADIVPYSKSIKKTYENPEFIYFLVPEKFDNISQKSYVNNLSLLQNKRIYLKGLYKELLNQITMLLVLLENEKLD